MKNSRAPVLRFAESDAFSRLQRTRRGSFEGSGGVPPKFGSGGCADERGEVIMSDSSEVIVVASKVKTYIKSQGDMKTSANVLQTLSDRIRSLCNEAIESARSDGRKTVLDRDIP